MEDHGTPHCVGRQSQFSRSHRGLTVLLGGHLKSGPTLRETEADRQVASSLRPVAHLVMRPGCRPGETSSILVRGAKYPCSSAEEHSATNRGVGSSNLSRGSTFKNWVHVVEPLRAAHEPLKRRRAVEAHRTHNPEVLRSNRSAATSRYHRAVRAGDAIQRSEAPSRVPEQVAEEETCGMVCWKNVRKLRFKERSAG